MSFLSSFFEKVKDFINKIIEKIFGRVEVEEEVEEEEVGVFYEHFVSGLFYCHGKKRVGWVLTYTDDDVDLEIELRDILEDIFSDECSEMRQYYGYMKRETLEVPYFVWREYDYGLD